MHEKPSEKILVLFKERLKNCQNAQSENRKVSLEDLKFTAGEQWPEEVKKNREEDNRPCLTINKMPQFIRQVTNDQRQNRPAIKIYPNDDQADVKTAKVLQGLIKNIEYNSNADIAYDTAYESAVRGGFGFIRVLHDYISPTSFEQEILIKPVVNPFNVYIDHNAVRPDGSDAEYAMILDRISKEEFTSLYPNAELSKEGHWDILTENNQDFLDKDSCLFIEYFYKDYQKATIYKLIDSSITFEKPEDEAFIVDQRETEKCTIKWIKTNGVEILEETEWGGTYIPIVPVYGDVLFIDGKIITESLIRHAKDSQRQYNYWVSTETETITLAPKAPFIVYEGQITKENKQNWAKANTKSFSYLEVKPITIGGQVAPLPQRNTFEPPIMAVTQARTLASEDIKATTGIYDPSLGNRSNETSGIAIQRRNQQAQTSNFHFVDNLSRSLRQVGRIVLELIPKIYDTARVVRIIGDDGEQDIIKIKEQFRHKNENVTYDFSIGKYDVIVETGPSYSTRRQEAVTTMLELSKHHPQFVQAAGDLMVKAMDFPMAQEVSERIKKLMPPNLLEQNNQNIPPEILAEKAQMQQMIEALSSKLEQANETMKTKKLELDSKERIEFAKLEIDIKKTILELQSKEAAMAFEVDLADINSRLEKLNLSEPVQSDAAQTINPTGGLSSGQFIEE